MHGYGTTPPRQGKTKPKKRKLHLLFSLLALSLSISTVEAMTDVQVRDGHSLSARTDVTVTITATAVAPVNRDRLALNCTNHGTDPVRWGGPDVTSTKGQRIASGASITIRNTSAIYMITEGADVTVSCSEEQP